MYNYYNFYENDLKYTTYIYILIMCVVVAGETEPDTTKLFSIPVIVEGGVKSTLSIYVNNFDVTPDDAMDGYNLPSMAKKPTMSGLYYNAWGQLVGYPQNEQSETQSVGSHTNGGAIMVVAYPVEKDVENPLIGLVDISTDTMKKFRVDVEALNPIMKKNFTESDGATFGLVSNSLKPLKVYDVGNYKISVALGFSALESRLDWTKFTKPDDFELRIKTLLNPKLYPPTYKWFYVVASAVKNVKNDGFGVVYPRLSADLLYFPTAHEQRKDNSVNSGYEFDYKLFGYSMREKPDAQITLTSNEVKVDDHRNLYFNNKNITKPLDRLKNLQFIDLSQNKLRLNPDLNVRYLSLIEKNGKDDNHNWFL